MRARITPRQRQGSACIGGTAPRLLLQHSSSSSAALRIGHQRRHRQARPNAQSSASGAGAGGGGTGWRAAESAPTQPAMVFDSPASPSSSRVAADAAPTEEQQQKQPTVRLAVYTKPGCPLCDNLAGRAQAVLDRAVFLPGGGPLGRSGVDVRSPVERRDVSGDAKWARLHAGEVPVLVMLRKRTRRRKEGGGHDEGDEGEEEEELRVARPPPRVTADKLERHLAAAAADLLVVD